MTARRRQEASSIARASQALDVAACGLRFVGIADGDLVLVDAGCEYDHYTADITRTWPANGRFSPVQRRVYDIVFSAREN